MDCGASAHARNRRIPPGRARRHAPVRRPLRQRVGKGKRHATELRPAKGNLGEEERTSEGNLVALACSREELRWLSRLAPCLHIWSPLQVPSLELESKLAASVEPGYNFPRRVRDGDLASDGTSQPGEAAAGFVQRPAIPPRPRRVTSRSPLEITAEYRAIVRRRRWKTPCSVTIKVLRCRRMPMPLTLRWARP